MKVKVQDILPGTPKVVELDKTSPVLREILDRLSADDPSPGPAGQPDASAALELSREGKTVFVKGEARATLFPACARCLKTVRVELSPDLDLTMFPEPEALRGEKEERGSLQEADEYSYSNDEIDVGALLNEFLLLERPYRVLCSESCKGLCPSCGANLNDGPCPCPKSPAHPAFKPLADFKLKE